MSEMAKDFVYSDAQEDRPTAIVNATGGSRIVFQCVGTSNSPSIIGGADGTEESLFDCDRVESTNPGEPPCLRSRSLVACDHFFTYFTYFPISVECPEGTVLRIALNPFFPEENVITTVDITSNSTFGPIVDLENSEKIVGNFRGNRLQSLPGASAVFTIGSYSAFLDAANSCDAWSERIYYNNELTTVGKFLYDQAHTSSYNVTCSAPSIETNELPSSSNALTDSDIQLASNDPLAFIVEQPEVANSMFDFFMRAFEFLIVAALAAWFRRGAQRLVRKGHGVHPNVLEGLGGNFSIWNPLKSKSGLGFMVATAALFILILESTLEFGLLYRTVVVPGEILPVWDAKTFTPRGIETFLTCQLFRNCPDDAIAVVEEANTAVVFGSNIFTHAPFGVPIRNLGGKPCLFGGESVNDTTLSLPRFRPRGGTSSDFRYGGKVGVFEYCERNISGSESTFQIDTRHARLDLLIDLLLLHYGNGYENGTRAWGYVDVMRNEEIIVPPINTVQVHNVSVHAASFEGAEFLEASLVLSSPENSFYTLGSEGWYSVIAPTEYCTPRIKEQEKWHAAEAEDGRSYSLDLLLQRSKNGVGTCVVTGPVVCVHANSTVEVNGEEAQCVLYDYTASSLLSDAEVAPALACARAIASERGASERSNEIFIGACILALSGESEAVGGRVAIELQIQWWLLAVVVTLASISLMLLVLEKSVMGKPSYRIPTTPWQGYVFGLFDYNCTLKCSSKNNYEFPPPPKDARVGIVYLDDDNFDAMGMTDAPEKDRGRSPKKSSSIETTLATENEEYPFAPPTEDNFDALGVTSGHAPHQDRTALKETNDSPYRTEDRSFEHADDLEASEKLTAIARSHEDSTMQNEGTPSDDEGITISEGPVLDNTTPSLTKEISDGEEEKSTREKKKKKKEKKKKKKNKEKEKKKTKKRSEE